MAFLNIFKRKKPERKTLPKRDVKQAEVKKTVPKKANKAALVSSRAKKSSDIAYRILKGPHVTERATDLTALNQYVFNVFRSANKPQIKKVVEDIYGVDVVAVRIINIPAKKRRLGRTEGWRQQYKKAIVKVKQGQKIEVLPR
ncbi:MAG: 50S ribosomal protein L23 [Candidatus Nealsonbacteria bacterium]